MSNIKNKTTVVINLAELEKLTSSAVMARLKQQRWEKKIGTPTLPIPATQLLYHLTSVNGPTGTERASTPTAQLPDEIGNTITSPRAQETL